jgi:tetraacyldisaccharide 4'-kinase
VLSRGYKRKRKNFIIADAESTPDDIGDEPYQMAQKFKQLTVAVDEKRVRGIHKLQHHNEKLKVILLDDAFQHRYVKPGISILLVDYNQPVFNDYLLPFGNLREQKHEMRRANIIIVSKAPKGIKPIEKRIWMKELKLFPYQKLYFTTLAYGDMIPVYSKKQKRVTLADINAKKTTIILLTGIANNKTLLKRVQKLAHHVVEMTYPDHYRFSQTDIRHITEVFNNTEDEVKYIVTTEKDAVRLQALNLKNQPVANHMYYLPIEIKFLDKKNGFDKDIVDFVECNKRISKLHS